MTLGKMQRIPPVKAVMTAFPYSIDRNESLERAREMMTEHGIRHLPVLDGDRLTRVLGERELSMAHDADPAAAKAKRVGDLARKAYVVELTEPLDVVLLHMARTHDDCAVVVKEGRLVGIFTTTDACRRFGELLRETFPRGGGHEAA